MACVGGCTTDSSGDTAQQGQTQSTTQSPRETTLKSLNIDWPQADGTLEVVDAPAPPSTVPDATYNRMVSDLTAWAEASAADPAVWQADDAVDRVADALAGPAGEALKKQVSGEPTPRLAAANAMSKRVTVVGSPRISTAWNVRTVDEGDEPYVVVELQTRAAYEVRLGKDGPSRVIGVLRVHSLSAYPDTSDEFGVGGGWQEFGAGNCAMALDDSLLPDADRDKAAADVRAFVKIGNSDSVEMPELDDGARIDARYVQRCRQGSA
jgi:hypothetical protein